MENNTGSNAVVNENGKHYADKQWDAVVNMMDDDLRRELDNDLCPCTAQEFFDAYVKLHLERFGEEWELSKANPIW